MVVSPQLSWLASVEGDGWLALSRLQEPLFAGAAGLSEILNRLSVVGVRSAAECARRSDPSGYR